MPIFQPNSIIQNDPRLVKAKGLWDTGATVSSISQDLATRMGLKPITTAIVHHAKGSSPTNVYYLDIYLPNGIRFPFRYMLEATSVNGNFDVIIGMDIINAGDFSITNFQHKTVFTFRIPSMGTVDYVNEAKNQERSAFSKIGRNDPCLCRSGKSYKDCCWKKFH
jgi:hypothetical protein